MNTPTKLSPKVASEHTNQPFLDLRRMNRVVWLFVLCWIMECNSLFESEAHAGQLDTGATGDGDVGASLSLFSSGPDNNETDHEPMPMVAIAVDSGQPSFADDLGAFLPKMRGRGRPRRCDGFTQKPPNQPAKRPLVDTASGDQVLDRQRESIKRARCKRWQSNSNIGSVDAASKAAAAEGNSNMDMDCPGSETQSLTERETMIGKISAYLFTGDMLRTTITQASTHLGCTRFALSRNIRRICALAYRCQDRHCGRLLQSLLKLCRNNHQDADPGPSQVIDLANDDEPLQPEGLSAHLFMRVRQYDETPVVLHIQDTDNLEESQPKSTKNTTGDVQLPLLEDGHHDEDGNGSCVHSTNHAGASSESSVQVPLPQGSAKKEHLKADRKRSALHDKQCCKIFVTESRWAAMFVKRKGAVVDSTVNDFDAFDLECQVQSPLQCIKSNSASDISQALEQTVSKDYDAEVNSRFRRVLSIISSDSLSSNFAAERLLTKREEEMFPDTDFGKLHVSCDVHKVHGVAKALMNEFTFTGSGLVKSALYLRAGGVSSFRSAFKQVLRKRIKIYHNQPPSDTEHRSLMLNLFFQDHLQDTGLQMLNGNWMDGGGQHIVK